jgi:hypothetical protein
LINVYSHADWRRSRRCESGSCVEVAQLAGSIGMRDSKMEQSPVLVFTRPVWDAFVAGIRAGEFELD